MSVVGARGIGAQPLEAGQDKLEALLFKATNPSNKIEDVNTIKLFCDQIEHIQDGAILAGRLLSHKIQSPQEREALQALAVVEAAAKSSRAFVVEIGKFRFLNEMIKLVSPKYYGGRTPEPVKQKVIELLYFWTKQFPQEKKIGEAYLMLKGQGIVQGDPVHVREAVFAASLKPRSADLSEAESQRLQQLLHSGTPENLVAANRIIQGMVKKEEVKLEKATRQAMQLQEVMSSTRLLSDMLEQEGVATGQGEREIMADLYQACESWRPKLFRLAADAEEDDDAIGDILYASDELSRVMDKYKDIIILNKTDRTPSGVANRDLSGLTSSNHPSINSNSSSDPLQQFMLGSNNQTVAGPQIARVQNGAGNPHVQNGAAAARAQNGGNDSENSSILGLDDLVTNAVTEEVFSRQNVLNSNPVLKAKAQEAQEANLLFEERQSDYIADLLSEFGTSSETKHTEPKTSPPPHDLLSDQPVSTFSNQDQSLTNALLANLSLGGGVPTPQPELQKQSMSGGFAELDKLGERALIAHLPDNKEAVFVARKQDRLPMRELMRQRSSASDYAGNTKGPETSSAVEQNKPTNSQSEPTDFSKMDSRINHSEPTNVVLTLKDETVALTAIATNPELSEANPIKLSDISVGLDEVTPHPGLEPVVLVEGEGGVSAVLHPTSTYPSPGVRVYVLQLTNISKLQVEEVDFKAAVPKGCKVRLLKGSSSVLPAPAPFAPPPNSNQLMLVLSGPGSVVELSFVLSYSVDEEPVTHIGKEVLPEQSP